MLLRTVHHYCSDCPYVVTTLGDMVCGNVGANHKQSVCKYFTEKARSPDCTLDVSFDPEFVRGMQENLYNLIEALLPVLKLLPDEDFERNDNGS